MKKTLLWCLIGLISLGSSAFLRAQTTEGTEKAVAALEEKWLQALNTNNPDLLTPLLADKYVSTLQDGKVTGKAEEVAEVKTFVKNSAANSELKVIVYGDTAKMKVASGKVIDLNIHWTDTWVKMPSGQWQCVASHASSAKM
jgi:hypothetical protein